MINRTVLKIQWHIPPFNGLICEVIKIFKRRKQMKRISNSYTIALRKKGKGQKQREKKKQRYLKLKLTLREVW